MNWHIWLVTENNNWKTHYQWQLKIILALQWATQFFYLLVTYHKMRQCQQKIRILIECVHHKIFFHSTHYVIYIYIYIYISNIWVIEVSRYITSYFIGPICSPLYMQGPNMVLTVSSDATAINNARPSTCTALTANIQMVFSSFLHCS